MVWTALFWIGMLSAWCVTIGHCLPTWLSAVLFSVILFLLAPTFPIIVTIVFSFLYLVGAVVVFMNYPSIALILYLLFIIPSYVVISGQFSGRAKVPFRKQKKHSDFNRQDIDRLNLQKQEITNYINKYHSEFLRGHQSVEYVISANKVRTLSSTFISSLSNDDTKDFLSENNQNPASAALSAIMLAISNESKKFQNDNGKIHADTLPLEALTHLTSMFEFMQFALEKAKELDQPEEPTEEVIFEEPEDEFFYDA